MSTAGPPAPPRRFIDGDPWNAYFIEYERHDTLVVHDRYNAEAWIESTHTVRDLVDAW